MTPAEMGLQAEFFVACYMSPHGRRRLTSTKAKAGIRYGQFLGVFSEAAQVASETNLVDDPSASIDNREDHKHQTKETKYGVKEIEFHPLYLASERSSMEDLRVNSSDYSLLHLATATKRRASAGW